MIYVGLPDLAARRAIVEHALDGVPTADDVDLDELAQQLEGYSGADIAGSRGVIDTATDFPYERAIDGEEAARLTRDDISRAIEAVKPTVSGKALARYARFANER
jgi:transitional endoplasmic reticulum ATPase